MLSFFFYDPAPTEIYTLSLHDALPILWNPEPFTAGTDAGRIFRIEERAACNRAQEQADAVNRLREIDPRRRVRSEEHTSELQSRRDLVCRLLLEKKKHNA